MQRLKDFLNYKNALLFALLSLNSSLLTLSAQSHVMDSLQKVLKTEKDDTNKINTLNWLSYRLEGAGSYDSSIVYAKKAQILADNLQFKRGLAKALQNIGYGYFDKGSYNEAVQYVSKALAIDEGMGNKSAMAGDLGCLGNIYFARGDYPQALKYQFKALVADQDAGSKSGIAVDLVNIGNNYFEMGDYPQALEYDLKALTISKQIQDTYSTAEELGNIGGIYYQQGNYEQALEYDFKALAINQKNGNKNLIAANLGNIGFIYAHQKNYDKALDYDLKSLSIREEIGDKNGEASEVGNIGNVYSEQGNYTKAMEYFLKSLQMERVMGDKDGIAYKFGDIGMIYLKQKKYKQAKEMLDSSLTISKGIGEKDDIKSSYAALADLDSITGNFKQGLEDFKNYITYRDSLINEANTKKTVQAQMNFDFEQRQAKEKAEQDKKDAIANQERNKQKVIRNSFIAGFALTLALAFFIFRGYRQKQKDNIIITQQKEEVEKQKTLVEHQKDLVEEKNKDILDSITYAKRLQDAILPPLSIIKQYLPESFVLYKPKDIVAGDFYWMERSPLPMGEGQGEVTLIAAADCTGHGVPGALVSVVCSNALNRTVKEFKITEPGKILDKVRELVLETFEKSESNVQDGMDISLCSISPLSAGEGPGVRLQWSGAYNSLWYIQNGKMTEIPADKQPIGKTDNPKPFTTHTVTIPQASLNPSKGGTKEQTEIPLSGGVRGAGTVLYLFTDGFADQFGGPKGKKFKYKQLQQLIIDNAQLTMEQQKKLLEQKFEEWKQDLEQVDDVLIIGVRI